MQIHSFDLSKACISRNKISDLKFEWKASVECFLDNIRRTIIDCNDQDIRPFQ